MYSVTPPPAAERLGYYQWVESLRRIAEARNDRRSLLAEAYALATQDRDGDGVPDRFDNCPVAANGQQRDFDRDGLGDTCDRDDDNDGITDALDVAPHNASIAGYAQGEAMYRYAGEGSRHGEIVDVWG